MFCCGFEKKEESDIALSISYGSSDKYELGIINFDFSDYFQKTVSDNFINELIQLLIEDEAILNVAAVSPELEDKILDMDYDYIIGWSTYLSNKDILPLLPPTVIIRKNTGHGIWFTFNSNETVCNVVKAAELLGEKGLLNI